MYQIAKSFTNIIGGHALAHYKVPRSDLHCVCVNVTSTSTATGSSEDPPLWDIFCFEVDIWPI